MILPAPYARNFRFSGAGFHLHASDHPVLGIRSWEQAAIQIVHCQINSNTKLESTVLIPDPSQVSSRLRFFEVLFKVVRG